MSSAIRCSVKRPGGRVCPGLLVARVDRIGRVLFDCPACARRKAGICADCPRPVVGRPKIAERCAACRAIRLREDNRTWRSRDVEHYRTLARVEARKRRVKFRAGARPMTRTEIGKIAGAARAAALSPRRRSEIARLAVTTRWAKHRAAQGIPSPTTEVAA